MCFVDFNSGELPGPPEKMGAVNSTVTTATETIAYRGAGTRERPIEFLDSPEEENHLEPEEVETVTEERREEDYSSHRTRVTKKAKTDDVRTRSSEGDCIVTSTTRDQGSVNSVAAPDSDIIDIYEVVAPKSSPNLTSVVRLVPVLSTLSFFNLFTTYYENMSNWIIFSLYLFVFLSVSVYLQLIFSCWVASTILSIHMYGR